MGKNKPKVVCTLELEYIEHLFQETINVNLCLQTGYNTYFTVLYIFGRHCFL